LAFSLGLLAAGCETQETYAPCELDSEVTSKGICASDKKGGDTSCVVTEHPHCDTGICLSYFSKAPRCSIACTSPSAETSASECGPNAFCFTFKDEVSASGAKLIERYCVPKELK